MTADQFPATAEMMKLIDLDGLALCTLAENGLDIKDGELFDVVQADLQAGLSQVVNDALEAAPEVAAFLAAHRHLVALYGQASPNPGAG
jgi:hypothetical protein